MKKDTANLSVEEELKLHGVKMLTRHNVENCIKCGKSSNDTTLILCLYRQSVQWQCMGCIVEFGFGKYLEKCKEINSKV